MSEYIHKSHNVSVLMYHFVCPAKYRKSVFSAEVDETLKEICLEISKRYEIIFLEIGTDKNHVHFLVQSVPKYSPTKIIQTIKSITAREIFAKHPEVKKKLWGGEFWSDGYFVNTVSKFGSEATIRNYVKKQGIVDEYVKLHEQTEGEQLTLF
ncbi:IS200/IS605 family transposase [Paenibacillus sp. P46E]|uniref:IS200/IS605 family transposase n=1 Tax=Paenibacillus sp. P46E TaxID=1349436 RepID=UPI0009396E43|nr:IS200/IS605 family transposase [Paenibacillus sp. P46E]OKP96967.1 transposase [Paenibacillus sp. P46E]